MPIHTLHYWRTNAARSNLLIGQQVLIGASLAIACVLLAETPTILAAAGGLVGHYLTVVLFTLVPLGWARRQSIKIVAALMLLTSVLLAYHDHQTGVAYQARVLRVRFLGDLHQSLAATRTSATCPATEATAIPKGTRKGE